MHDDDLADELPRRALDQQRHVQHARARPAHPALDHRPQHRAAHRGVHDRVQRPPLPLVAEHDAPELLAVERPVGEEDVGPEGAGDGAQGGRAGGDGRAREEVRVDDGDVRREERGDGGLAGGDSACEADD